MWGVQSVGKGRVEGGLKQKRGTEGQRKKREKKEVKKQGQYTQRNVVLQTVELAKIKMHCHYGNTRRKRREKD